MWSMNFYWEYFLVSKLLLEMLTLTQAIKVEVWGKKVSKTQSTKCADFPNIKCRKVKIFLLKIELELQNLVKKF